MAMKAMTKKMVMVLRKEKELVATTKEMSSTALTFMVKSSLIMTMSKNTIVVMQVQIPIQTAIILELRLKLARGLS